MNDYVTKQEKRNIYRRNRRERGLLRVAEAHGTDPKCAVCGCPHLENLQIGHPNGDGKSHRSLSGIYGSREMINWVLRASSEQIREKVRLECPYCNAYHQKFREYPPIEKRPKW